ncbi:16S rRNA (uracil(1498)-N(3))-methyltransferase [Homoserinibacter sp. YIM 151385]|uniref:16S rRNA (uracil(1498)-N(3))-methyltransferase n=1 Tax=Homoserinibacter sp. YIM 151385 TaxID=2985506 RepID=UPI0022F0233F|nr:16S rRNA (uracil(1498)-N(3))-methyltransferase [Homoserinibacter sp. YIM 151385]WBU38930.1 16S rRNA (uracil(1498)-N(3))-methyltransferase [Homoserinibacter sp. YIM 151385]
MAWLYLDPELDRSLARVGAHVGISGEEARHAVQVARTRLGERVSIGDGTGLILEGEVVQADAAGLAIRVERVVEEPVRLPELWLAQALAKGDRDELAVQAATELGATGILPWQAERSVSRWAGPKAEKGRARWGAIVREASKQAIRAHVPEVAPLASTAELAAFDGLVVVLDPRAGESLMELEPQGVRRILLVVGPEGGISPRELETLAAAGARPMRIGGAVLRTSTAGPAALAVLNTRLARW